MHTVRRKGSLTLMGIIASEILTRIVDSGECNGRILLPVGFDLYSSRYQPTIGSWPSDKLGIECAEELESK